MNNGNAARFNTEEEYKKEIARVQAAMQSTSSPCLRRDYGKYMKRLQKEMRWLHK